MSLAIHSLSWHVQMLLMCLSSDVDNRASSMHALSVFGTCDLLVTGLAYLVLMILGLCVWKDDCWFGCGKW